MLVPEHVVPFLATAGVGTLGVDLFCYHLPAPVLRGVMITGDLAGTDIDHDLPGWRQGRLQLIVRDPDVLDGIVKARLAMSALTLNDHDLAVAGGAPAVRLRRLRPAHDPIVYPRSDGDGVELSVNFEAVWVARG